MSLEGLQEAGFQGFRPPGSVWAAWDAALAGGVPGLMDFEDVSLLGHTNDLVFAQQELLDLYDAWLVHRGR